MSVAYTWVGWNRQKRIYDAVLVAGITVYLMLFVLIGAVLTPPVARVSEVILLIRALGTCAMVMLTAIVKHLKMTKQILL